MRIQVGIIGNIQAWKAILGQEGVPSAEISGSLSAGDYSAVVVSGPVPADRIQDVKHYLAQGGSVLCSGAAYRALTGERTDRKYISYVMPDEHFAGAGLVDINATCEIPGGAMSLPGSNGKSTASISKYKGGNIIVLPFDGPLLFLDNRTAKRSFYRGEGRLPHERVSRVSKGGIRKIIARSLERLHHMRELPYAHVWYYPHEERSLFQFRIDTDYASKVEIEMLYELCTRHLIPATWFIHVAAHARYLNVFREMRKQELALHCNQHEHFFTTQELEQDIRRGLEVLGSERIEPHGYAAPYGQWNATYARVISASSFGYSSEFGYDYDNLPSYPSVDGKVSTVLQVPVHPIGIGSMRRQGMRRGEMSVYMERMLIEKLRSRDPLFFYHHPRNEHHEILEQLFEAVHAEHIRAVTMEEFALWWKKRSTLGATIDLDGSQVHVRGSSKESDARIRLTREDGTEAFISPGGAYDLNSLRWKPIPGQGPLPENIYRIRRFNPWIAINTLENSVTNLFRSK